MQKIYLLLRNNKQSGPHSLEELQELMLKPSDLVWVEGKIGWKNPEEITELTIETRNTFTPAESEKMPGEKAKPIKVPNRKIFVSLPGNRIQSSPAMNTAEDSKEIDPAIALEKKAEALYMKIQAYQEQQSSAPKEALETKYNRSLEDIKNEYAGWLDQKKNKKPFQGKKLMLVAASVMVLILSGFFMYQGSVTQSNLPGEEIIQPKTVSLQASQPVAKSMVVKPESSIPMIKSKKTATTNFKNKPAEKKQPVIVSRKELPVATNTSLPSQVTINGRYKPVGRGVSASEITLNNSSDENLKFVAVDVIYYSANGSALTRETIYFRDIAPRTSLTLKAPPNDKAEEVKYKMGLISASETGLYYTMH